MRNKFLTFIESLSTNDTKDIVSTIKSGYFATYPQVPKQIFQECFQSLHLFDDNTLIEGTEEQIANIVNTPEFDTNGDLNHDYEMFMTSMGKSRHPESLTMYSLEEYADKGATLYKLKGIDAGFAVDKGGDIISVHNNSPLRGLGRPLIQLAKKVGGNKLDHYDIAKLNEVYGNEGFKETSRMDWDDQYAPEKWDYEKSGRPDVVMREL